MLGPCYEQNRLYVRFHVYLNFIRRLILMKAGNMPGKHSLAGQARDVMCPVPEPKVTPCCPQTGEGASAEPAEEDG